MLRERGTYQPVTAVVWMSAALVVSVLFQSIPLMLHQNKREVALCRVVTQSPSKDTSDNASPHSGRLQRWPGHCVSRGTVLGILHPCGRNSQSFAHCQLLHYEACPPASGWATMRNLWLNRESERHH